MCNGHRKARLRDVLKFPSIWNVFALLLLSLFRLCFGFFAVMDYEDQRQIYLIGLKYDLSGLWPYFGADVSPHVQMPGALQGLVVGLPLRLWAVPESPFVLVNILSLSALAFFAWYCCRRLPAFPKWIVWGWLLTSPWTLNVSTNVYNVSYVLFGGVLFFVGFLESVPTFRISVVPPWLANLMMGFAFFWNAQFHASFMLLVPFLAFSAYQQAKQSLTRDSLLGLACFLLGASMTGSLLIPTLLRYGWDGFGGTATLVRFQPSHLATAPVILAQLFSLASAEVPRFLGRDIAARLEFFRAQTWAAPFTFVALMLGLLQPIVMSVFLFRRQHDREDWRAIKTLTLATFGLICLSFWFAAKWPKSHMYYVTIPLIMLFAFYVFSPWGSKRWFQTTVAILLICNLGFHVGLASSTYRGKSLYAYRESIRSAIETKDYTRMGKRRSGARY